jgi:hypothetical protein
MQKIFIPAIVILLFIFSGQSYCQDFISTQNNSKSPIFKKFNKDNLFFGGQLGLLFGSVTNICIAPEVGYRFTEKFGLGIGISYNYYAEKEPYSFHTDIYGGKVFGYYIVIDNLFAYAEYQGLNLETQYFNPILYPQTKRYTVSSFLVGPGYRIQAGSRAYIKLMFLWNLLENSYSVSSGPELRVSIEL